MGAMNHFKTALLLGLLAALLMGVGWLIGGYQGLTIGLIFALVMNFGSYYFSDRIVLAIYRAKEAKQSEYPDLHRIVREVSQLAGIPVPRIYVVPSQISNAFASGRSPKHAVVAVTEGIMNLLSKDELKGVIAHEISHIKNRDILIQTIAATIAAVISYVAMMARWAAIFGGVGGRDDRGSSGLELIILAILTPLLALLIRMAISRSREYLADESGARIIHNGYGLANALEKLEGSAKRNPLRFGGTTEATAHMFIVNPFKKSGLVNLFMTHPPVAERVKRLKGMRV